MEEGEGACLEGGGGEGVVCEVKLWDWGVEEEVVFLVLRFIPGDLLLL